MDATERWLALLATPGLGPVTLRRLLKRAGSAERLIRTPYTTLAGWGLPQRACQWLRRPDRRQLLEQKSRLARVGAHCISIDDERYPLLLKETAGAPLVLFVRGSPHCLQDRQLAIVGSRNPSPGGIATARELAFAAARAGLTITSGLASGIDGAAHRGALEAGGSTIAVMGTGPERIYPAGHRELAEHIIVAGALVTEFPPGTTPRRQNFPRRNRLISGLCLGTLVVEAAPGSGSLITAHYAAEQGREVLAVPGSIHNPLTRGCHRLIRDGARLVESIDDVLEELGFLALRQPPPGPVDPPPPADSAASRELELLALMGFDPVTPDELVQRSGLTAAAVCSILFSLEITGSIEPTPGGAFIRVSKRPLHERKRS